MARMFGYKTAEGMLGRETRNFYRDPGQREELLAELAPAIHGTNNFF